MAMYWFLKTYAKEPQLAKVARKFHEARQEPGVTEHEFANRLTRLNRTLAGAYSTLETFSTMQLP